MNSLYRRQFTMMAALIVLSFALLGATFIGLSYRYTVTEKREAMERNADYIANFRPAAQLWEIKAISPMWPPSP